MYQPESVKIQLMPGDPNRQWSVISDYLFPAGDLSMGPPTFFKQGILGVLCTIIEFAHLVSPFCVGRHGVDSVGDGSRRQDTGFREHHLQGCSQIEICGLLSLLDILSRE